MATSKGGATSKGANSAKSVSSGTGNSAESPEDPKKKKKMDKRHLWPTILGRKGTNKEATDLARAHIESKAKPTAAVINRILNTKVTEAQLGGLINGPRRKFHSITDPKVVLKELTQGKPRTEKPLAGVYI